MSYTITKVFKLDMGHRTWTQDMRIGRGKEHYSTNLPYSYNKCANFHGHSLLIHITLTSHTLDEQNFVIDTDLIKIPFNKIIHEMDHSFIMDENDPLFNDFNKLIKKENLKLFIVDFSPSFEALSEYFYKRLSTIIEQLSCSQDLKATQVKITGEHMTVEAIYAQ